MIPKIIILLFLVCICLLTIKIYKNEYFSLNKYNLYVFWTGNNKMSDNRKKCLESIKKNTKVNVILVTPENLKDYIVSKYPLHPSYKYLSLNHKSDYLRTYFMHIHGGGYTDIKNWNVDWNPFFKKLYENDDKWFNGYREIDTGSASNDPEIHKNHKKYIGNCAFIFKKNTPFTKKWFDTVNYKLDLYLEKLKKNPAKLCDSQQNCKKTNYPIPWTYLQGSHFHDIMKPYLDKALYDLPLIDVQNYR
jgi:hypothetical protein